MRFCARMRLAAGFAVLGLGAAQDLPHAVSALDKGRFEEAVTVLTDLLRRAPDNADANYYLGLAYLRMERPREARPYLEHAAALSPAKPAPWKEIGLLFLKSGDYNAAAAALAKACSLDATDEDGCYLLGRSLYALGRFDEAVEPFEKALQHTAPGNLAAAHRAAALNFAELGRAADAERHFLAAVRLYDRGSRTQPDPHLDYGAFLIGQGRAEDSLEFLRRAVAASPASSRAHAELGRALLELDRPAEALPELKAAVDRDPNAWAVRLILAKTYLRLGRRQEGEREMRLGREGWAKQDHGSSKVR